MDDLTDTLAGWLYAKGVRIGSAVGIFMEHRAEYALAYIAAHKVCESKHGEESRSPSNEKLEQTKMKALELAGFRLVLAASAKTNMQTK